MYIFYMHKLHKSLSECKENCGQLNAISLKTSAIEEKPNNLQGRQSQSGMAISYSFTAHSHLLFYKASLLGADQLIVPFPLLPPSSNASDFELCRRFSQ